MTCSRCKGFMISDRYNVLSGEGPAWLSMWRCMNCGDIVDEQILGHRSTRKPSVATVFAPVGALPSLQELLAAE